MEFALLLSALALALAGVPHCAAMCAAPCAAVTGRGATGPVAWTFHAARVLSYALAGAVAAGSVGALAALAQWSPLLRPLWTLLHAAAFVLGLWMLWQGRQPMWLESVRPAWSGSPGPAACCSRRSCWRHWPTARPAAPW
jgi:sulfite exporter TauE/SafE